MKLAMSNIAWAAEERLGAYAILAEAGITGLEIAPGIFFHASDDPFIPDAAIAREALREAADTGLSLVSMQSLLFGVTGAGLFGGAEARAVFKSGMNRAITLAGRFGIPNLVFGSPAQRRVPAGLASKDALSEAIAVLRRLGDAGAVAGTRITIEANPVAYGTNFINMLEEANAFVQAVDHPANPRARILVLGDDTFAARAGAMGGFATLMEPRNMADGRLGPHGNCPFVAELHIDYVLPRGAARAQWARANLPVVEVMGCTFTLYQVAR